MVKTREIDFDRLVSVLTPEKQKDELDRQKEALTDQLNTLAFQRYLMMADPTVSDDERKPGLKLCERRIASAQWGLEHVDELLASYNEMREEFVKTILNGKAPRKEKRDAGRPA